MNILKKLLLIVTFAACVTKVNAQADRIYTTNNMAVGISTIATNAGILTSFTAYTTNLSPTILYFYDGYYLLTNAAWTNYTIYTTNLPSSYITTTGVTNSFTNTVILTTPNAHAAVTGVVNTPNATVVIPGASSSGTITPITITTPIVFGSRLTLSNGATGLTLLGHYRNP